MPRLNGAEATTVPKLKSVQARFHKEYQQHSELIASAISNAVIGQMPPGEGRAEA
jgi:hypothetical protein